MYRVCTFDELVRYIDCSPLSASLSLSLPPSPSILRKTYSLERLVHQRQQICAGYVGSRELEQTGLNVIAFRIVYFDEILHHLCVIPEHVESRCVYVRVCFGYVCDWSVGCTCVWVCAFL